MNRLFLRTTLALFTALLVLSALPAEAKRKKKDVPTEEKSDDFWLVDASIGYRLPKRRGIVSIGVANLFDEQFNFVDTDPFNPRVYPERLVFGRFTLAF